MTTVLKDGDFAFDQRGRILEASGREELIQRALIRLKAKKGCFPLDPELGSELYRLDLNRAGEEELLPLIREALAPIPQLQTEGLKRSVDRDTGRLCLTVFLTMEGAAFPLKLSEDQP